MEKQQSQSEEVKTITPKEQAKADCDALCLLCSKMSDTLRKSIEQDYDFQALNRILSNSLKEYEILESEGRKTKKKRKEVNKYHRELNEYCYYNHINLMLLESPQNYACMICQNKQLVQTEDGDTVCELFLEKAEGGFNDCRN